MISLFNYIHIYIDFTRDNGGIIDMIYWEIALTWIYYGKDLTESIKLSEGWEEYNNGIAEPIKFKVLKSKYQQLYNTGNLPKIMYEERSKD